MTDPRFFSNPHGPYREAATGARVRIILPEGKHAHGYVESAGGEKAVVVLDDGSRQNVHRTNLRVENPSGHARGPGSFNHPTGHERNEWRRAARAMRERGRDDLARTLERAASQGFMTSVDFDKAASIYREWLVFDEPKPAQTVSQRAAYLVDSLRTGQTKKVARDVKITRLPHYRFKVTTSFGTYPSLHADEAIEVVAQYMRGHVPQTTGF